MTEPRNNEPNAVDADLVALFEDAAGLRSLALAASTAADNLDRNTYPEYTLLRLDASVIHAAPAIPTPGGERSFMKVSFSDDRYDLLGNAHNHEFDYDWPMHPRGAVRNGPATTNDDSAHRLLTG